MAKINNGVLGGFVGRVGHVVGYSWRGKWCQRSLPAKVSNPQTEAQQAHREMFKQEVQLAGFMNRVLRRTFDDVSRNFGMTACNYFIASNQQAFAWVGESLQVDWSSLRLSEGPVSPVAFEAPRVSHSTVVDIDFVANPLHGRADNYDEVFLYVYCPDKHNGLLSTSAFRRSKHIAIDLPQAFAGHQVQLWGMVCDDKGRWSNSIYIGGFLLEDTDDDRLVQIVDSLDDTVAAEHLGAVAADNAAAAVAVAAPSADAGGQAAPKPTPDPPLG